ncbi:hypothetical protein GBAR_LOCUS29502 [Geodia barretti]|uniref:SH3 domain-containing protein n=1 Tax=Geodia barretti TaxID=519541 RepID=A0AA35XJG7_GEOBA|nr:hypothetical protein GBAR_LOCUS29502 [Geodia barretti]
MEAVVLFDYEKQEGDELNLKVGEVITNVTQSQLPENPQIQVYSGEVPKGQRGRVLYGYEAKRSDEISLEPGQWYVLWDELVNGCVNVEWEKQKETSPAMCNFSTSDHHHTPPRQKPPLSHPRPASFGRIPDTGQQVKRQGMYGFEAKRSGEISLEPGQIVDVLWDEGEVPKGQRSRVLYRFEAKSSDEISLEPGQM